MSPSRAAATLVIVAAVSGGCQHKSHRCNSCGPGDRQPPGAYYLQPGAPIPTEPTRPFLGAPVVPSESATDPTPELLLPEPLPRGQSPAVGSGRNGTTGGSRRPSAASKGPRLGRPEVETGKPREFVRLLRPILDRGPTSASPSPEVGDPSVGGSPDVPLFPIGIPSFSPVYDSVATGERPDLGGLEWLRANRYRTLLRLRTPDQDDAADRRLIERLGFVYVDLSIDPEKPAAAIARFNEIVNDPEGRPLFVYDQAGSLAGPMWYAHFRTVAKLPDSEAAERASRFGLKPGDDPGQAALMSAIRAHLQTPGS